MILSVCMKEERCSCAMWNMSAWCLVYACSLCLWHAASTPADLSRIRCLTCKSVTHARHAVIELMQFAGLDLCGNDI